MPVARHQRGTADAGKKVGGRFCPNPVADPPDKKRLTGGLDFSDPDTFFDMIDYFGDSGAAPEWAPSADAAPGWASDLVTLAAAAADLPDLMQAAYQASRNNELAGPGRDARKNRLGETGVKGRLFGLDEENAPFTYVYMATDPDEMQVTNLLQPGVPAVFFAIPEETEEYDAEMMGQKIVAAWNGHSIKWAPCWETASDTAFDHDNPPDWRRLIICEMAEASGFAGDQEWMDRVAEAILHEPETATDPGELVRLPHLADN